VRLHKSKMRTIRVVIICTYAHSEFRTERQFRAWIIPIMLIFPLFAAFGLALGQSCPSIWTDIVNDLAEEFAGCNQAAAFAIRFAFHDAGKLDAFSIL
jgi:hypothetical protein